MSDSVRPHRRQPTRLPHPWDSPSKNTGLGCHFLLQCMKVKRESEVVQSCLILSDAMDCSLPGSSIHGIFQQQYCSGVPKTLAQARQFFGRWESILFSVCCFPTKWLLLAPPNNSSLNLLACPKVISRSLDFGRGV